MSSRGSVSPSSLHKRQASHGSRQSNGNLLHSRSKRDSYLTFSQTLRLHWHPFLLVFAAILLLVATIIQINSKRRHNDAPTSYIDWCEVNYHKDAGGWMIAELWNTISNASYLFVGLHVITMANRYKFLGARFVWLGVMLVFIGLFSALFHATLLWQTQNMDEAAETAALITFFHMGVVSDVTFWRLAIAHTLIASLCIVAIQLFTEFHLFSIVIGVIYRYEPEIKLLHPSTNARTHLVRSAAVAAAGFGCWIVDRAACDFLYGSLPFNPQLHAWWHILTGYALHEASLVAAAWKANQTGNKLTIHSYYGLVTFVSHKDSQIPS